MDFLECYFGLDWYWKVLVPLILIGISTFLWLDGYFWPWGWGLGVLLLLFAIPGKKNEWGDW